MIAASRTVSPSRTTSWRNPTGRYAPTRINANTKWRFFRSRKAELLRRIGGGTPDERQAQAIDMIIKTEWEAIVADHDAALSTSNKVRADARRIAADNRKQMLLWNRELTAASKPEPAPAAPAPTLADLFPGRNVA